LRSSARTIAFARDESVEGVDLNDDKDQGDLVGAAIDVETGLPTSTGRTVARTYIGGLYLPSVGLVPAIEVGSDEFAFLELETDQGIDRNKDGDLDDNFLVVFDRDGTDLTPAPPIEISPEPVIGGRTVVVSDGKVFFRSPGLLVQSLVDGVNGITSLDDVVGITASADGKNVYVGSDGSDNLITVFSRNPATGALTFLETEDPYGSGQSMAISPNGELLLVADGFITLSSFSRDPATGRLTLADRINTIGISALNGAEEVVISPDGAHAYVASSFDNSVGVFTIDASTGALNFIEAQTDGMGGVNGLAAATRVEISPDGRHVYVLGQLDDGIAVFSRDAGTGLLTFVEFVDFLALGPDLYDIADVPFQIAISPDGRFVYATEGAGPPSAWAYERNSVNGTLTFSSVMQNANPANNIVGGLEDLAISNDGTRAYGVSSGRDTFVTLRRDVDSGVLTVIGTITNGTAGANFIYFPEVLAVSHDDLQVYVGSDVSNAVTVLATDQQLQVYDTGTRSLRPTSVPTSTASVAAGRAITLASEPLTGMDFNGDGDFLDDVAQVLDVTGPTDIVTDLGVAASTLAISNLLIAVTVPEGSENNVSRNGDSDQLDTVLAVLAVGDSPPMTNVGAAADEILVTADRVVFRVTEGADGIDYTGDGDIDDIVVRIYDARTTQVVDPGVTASLYFAVDPYVAILVTEALEDPGSQLCLPGSPAMSCDLNGDGDDADDVLFIYDMDLREMIATGQAASPCNLVGCPQQTPFFIDPARRNVIFLTGESDQGKDLDGDGDAADLVLQTFNIVNGSSYTIEKIYDDDDPDLLRFFASRLPIFPTEIAGVRSWFVRVRECDLAFDLNEDGAVTCDFIMVLVADTDGDGIPDEFDTCVESANADGVDVDADGLGDSACDPTPAGATTTTTVSLCGNGLRNVGEACDGGQLGSCLFGCSSSCTCLEAPVCGDNVLDPQGEACDGTSDAACPGLCLPNCTCPTTTTTLPPLSSCPAAPVPTENCRLADAAGAGRSSLQIVNKSDDFKDQLKWKWNKGEATEASDFSDPVGGAATYRVCVYDSSASGQSVFSAGIPAGAGGALCGGKPCWRRRGPELAPKGYKFKDKAGEPDGVTNVKMKAGVAGKSQIQVKGKGQLLAPPDTAALVLPVTIQLLVDDGTVECFQTTFSSAGVAKQDANILKAKGP
jgi:6-phosphogluconolactonase (cycloisomerase 2 family)